MGNYLVTGANGGMGRAVCAALSGSGNRVWGIDLTPFPEDIPWRGIQADLTDESSLARASGILEKEAGSLNGIVHAAGIYDLDSLVEIPGERFLRAFDVNLFGVYRINRLLLPLLAAGSRIVVISSELAPLSPLPFTGLYAVTKGALEQYASALRMELRLLGHRVIVIRPGAVSTGMLDVSAASLDRFCAGTKLYRCNARRFRAIVSRVETRSIPPERIGETVRKALAAKHPRLVYSLNRSPLLLLFDLLPGRLRLWLIGKVIAAPQTSSESIDFSADDP